MTGSSPIEAATPQTRYAYKASLIGAAHQFELTEQGLSFRFAGRSGVWPYGEIAAIRLSYRPVSMQSRRFRADIDRAGGGQVASPNCCKSPNEPSSTRRRFPKVLQDQEGRPTP